MQYAPEPPIKDPAAEDASKSDALRIYSMEEVEKHDTRDSAWFVHHGQVRPLLIILEAFRCCPQSSWRAAQGKDAPTSVIWTACDLPEMALSQIKASN